MILEVGGVSDDHNASITPQVQSRSTGTQPIYNDLKGGRGE